MNTKKELALKLFELGAFKDYRQSDDGLGFKLAAHRQNPNRPLSPFYLNLRTEDNPKPGPLTPETVKRMGIEMEKLVREKNIVFDALAGIPNAGTPLAEAMHDAMPRTMCKPLLGLTKHRNDVYGIERVVQGDMRPGLRLLLVDDVTSDLKSKVRTAQILRGDFRFRISDCVIFVDRRPFGIRKDCPDGLNVESVFTIEELVIIGADHGRIPSDVSERIHIYLNPA
ncbi:MAG: hypothetical protein WC787_01885 [Patescibacteria group bacterium]|jgi:orotate phosphoribosyltransferase